jgi:hypothetical protein
MNVNRIANFEGWIQSGDGPSAPVRHAGFIAVPLPAGGFTGGLSFVESVYRCAFQRAQAELAPPPGHEFFACWN